MAWLYTWFAAFFGLLSSTYFYKHWIKKTSENNDKVEVKLSDRQELYNMLIQHIHIGRENNIERAYLEPVTNVHYEENNYAEPDDQYWSGVSLQEINDRL